jgi:uncharacterized repeat protein (TIGR03803 family)
MSAIKSVHGWGPLAAGVALALSGDTAMAQFAVLHSFTNGLDGASPQYGALAVSEGRLYGTAGAGGASGNGVVFSLNADGSKFTVLHTFTGVSPDGAKPYGSVSVSGSTLYGTTYGGGSGNGTVFKIGTNGTGYATLYSFATSSAYKPYSTVTPSGSMLYGTTYYSSGGVGAVYAVDTNGNGFATLHTFVGGASDGKTPMGGALVVDDGIIFGTALHGGPSGSGNDGVVFAMSTNGAYSSLFAFSGGATDGANPYGSVALSGNKLYGTTRLGGSANAGTVFSVNTDGTGFTTLYTFAGGTTNAANPYCTPTLDGSVLYGTTRLGGTNNLGTVFKINTDGGGFEILHHFSTADGSEPSGDLVLANNTLYGYTLKGGAKNVGTVFALTVGESGYAFEGTGLTNVLSGTVNDGAVSLSSVPTWIDNLTPDLPYTNETSIAVPPCDSIVSGRLIMTVWGGNADYACEMTVSINGTTLPFANPFVFGTTAYSNSLYNTEAPRAYGSGYGVWFVTIPVPTELIHTDGTPNAVRVVENDPSNRFDGRIQHVTLVTVYRSAALVNVFDYAISEGEGLLYSYPTAPKVDKRMIALDAVGTNDVVAAGLTALYTYGNTGQYDKLFFNGTQLGGDDVAQGDNTWGGSYGPSVVSFDVAGSLAVTNEVTFDVSASDVLDPPEGSVRPEFVVLGVTREAPLAIRNAQASAVSGFSFQWPGYSNRIYTVECSADLTNPNGWETLSGFSGVSGTNGLMNCVDPSGASARFYRVIRQ